MFKSRSSFDHRSISLHLACLFADLSRHLQSLRFRYNWHHARRQRHHIIGVPSRGRQHCQRRLHGYHRGLRDTPLPHSQGETVWTVVCAEMSEGRRQGCTQCIDAVEGGAHGQVHESQPKPVSVISLCLSGAIDLKCWHRHFLVANQIGVLPKTDKESIGVEVLVRPPAVFLGDGRQAQDVQVLQQVSLLHGLAGDPRERRICVFSLDCIMGFGKPLNRCKGT